MYGNLQILCEQYYFGSVTTDVNEVSFFSGLEPSLINSIDLIDYVKNESDLIISSRREEIDTIEDSLRLFTSFGSLDLSLSNLVRPRLFDFFIIDNNENPFYLYKIKMIDDGTLIFQGTLSPSDLGYSNPQEFNERETIDLTIYGWGKGFKDYFSSGLMPDLSFPNYWFEEEFNGNPLEVTSLLLLINALFAIPYSNIITDNGINDDTTLNAWRIKRFPDLVNPTTTSNSGNDPTYWFQNGYDYISSNQKLSPIDFFRKMCNAMGWVFYFKIVDNEMKFVVRNRVTTKNFFTQRQIDNADVIEYSVVFAEYRQRVKVIKIPALEAFGGDSIFYDSTGILIIANLVYQGKHDLVFSVDSTPPKTDLIYFTEAKLDLSAGWKIKPKAIEDYGFSKYFNGDNVNTKYENIFYNSGELTEVFAFSYDGRFLLEIDAGHNNFSAEKKKRKNLQTAVASDYNSGDNISGGDLIYDGNIGTAMCRLESGANSYTQYLALNNGLSGNRSYTRSPQFQSNIQALLTTNSNLNVLVKVKGFYHDIDEVLSFNNPADIFPFGYEYDIADVKADRKNKVTTYELRKRNV